MVPDVPRVEVCLAVVGGNVPVVAPWSILALVGVVKVQAAHLLVVVGRFVHVRGAGHQPERHIDDTTAQDEEPTHPAEFSLIHGSGLSHYSIDHDWLFLALRYQAMP